MNRILLIVDPQNDFITGSLAVPDAKDKMKILIEYVKSVDFDKVIVTLDWHPINHCSFEKNGGKWPEHCVVYTSGVLPEENLWKALMDKYVMNKTLIVVKKGCNSEVEEYGGVDRPTNATYIDSLCKNADEIWISGIMSEYCVKSTVEGLVEKLGYKNKLNLLLDCISTMDDHKTLLDYTDKIGIAKTKTI